jgi:hypothetical protein
VVAAFIDASGAQLSAPVGGAFGSSMGNFRSPRSRPRPQQPKPQVWAASFLGAGHDRVMTSAIRGGVSQHPKYQLY